MASRLLRGYLHICATERMKRFDLFNLDRELNRLRMAHHEAAHAVITWAHRIELREVWLSADGKEGYSDRVEDKDNEQLYARMGKREALRALAMIALAGGCAQRRWQAETYSYGCDSDMAMAITCLRRLAEDFPDLAESLDDVCVATDALVAEHWTKITALAGELLQRGTIPGNEAVTIIERASRGATPQPLG